MKPVFCGNFEYDARESDLERLFRKYGKVERVDMKAGKICFDLGMPILPHSPLMDNMENPFPAQKSQPHPRNGTTFP
ncbi:RS41 [Arabidopsis thaliana]|uniref:RS41 n=1 Tax=Arabidopsis thaliana TaxID=3702 RepID=A0A178UQX9_ARATH|nr:RS41 [Arabidopsis thaliana]